MSEVIKELERKKKKVTYRLGELITTLYKDEALRFVFTSQRKGDESEVYKLLRLGDYLDERIRKMEDHYGENHEATDVKVKGEDAVQCHVVVSENSKEDVVENDAVSIAVDEVEDEAVIQKEVVVCDEKVGAQDRIDDASEQECVFGDEDADLVCGEKHVDQNAVSEQIVESEAVATVDEEIENIPIEEITDAFTFSTDGEKQLSKEYFEDLRTGDKKLRERSIVNIARLSDKNCLRKAVSFALRDTCSEVRLAAVKAIYRARDEQSFDLFRMGVSDSERKVRLSAINALGNIFGEDGLFALEPLLQSSDPYTRGMTVTCIGVYCGSEGLKRAVELLNDESPYVRKNLIEMLGVVMPPHAERFVKRLLNDSDYEVKGAAERVLQKLSRQKARRVNHGKKQNK